MPIYKPSELHQFLERLGIHPKKFLSQNFLIDRNILQKIAATAQIAPNDLILEIGPGPGSLTEELLHQQARIIAVEKDHVLAKELASKPNPQLEVFCDDILEFPIEKTVSERLKGPEKAKVIANLPYNLTTPIIVQLVPMHHLFSSLILMVQEEVARRFVALPNTPDYSSFTVFLNFYSQPRYAFKVSSGCFYPKPNVESAIVVLDLKPPPQVSNTEDFFKLTRTAFKQRRKMLRSSLRDIYAPAAIETALQAIDLDARSRPEDLSLPKFLQFFEHLRGQR